MWVLHFGAQKKARCRMGAECAPLFLKLAPLAANLAKMLDVTANSQKLWQRRCVKNVEHVPQVVVEQALDLGRDTAVAVGGDISNSTYEVRMMMRA